MTVTLFNPQGEFSGNDTINEQNFYEKVEYLGLLLCGGWIVQIDDIKYAPIKLPEFLARMQQLKDIGDIYNQFLTYLTYIQHVRYIQISEFWEKNKELQNRI